MEQLLHHHDIICHFFPDRSVLNARPFGNGHINDTFKIDMQKGQPASYILQRINTGVFVNPESIVRTHLRLLELVTNKKGNMTIPCLIPCITGKYLHRDDMGNVWRMMEFVSDTYSVEVVSAIWQAREAGKAFGWFANKCHNLNASEFEEAIPDFHRLSHRIGQLNDAIRQNRAERLHAVQSVVDFFLSRQEELMAIEILYDKGLIPQRVVHNDTKINNLLFCGQEAVAVIDLDTVGPGMLLFDFGDGLRSCANTAAEDEKDISMVQFNMKAFKAFTKAYLQQVHQFLSPMEREHLFLAPIMMTFVMGIRFLTDYLNGDMYYKTAYIDHNLVRCKTQLALIESMEANKKKIRDTINKALKTTNL